MWTRVFTRWRYCRRLHKAIQGGIDRKGQRRLSGWDCTHLEHRCPTGTDEVRHRRTPVAREMLRLLYQSFRALLKPALPNKLVQRIFELKIMVINGEYTEEPPLRAGDSARYAWQYVIYAPIEKLYTFLLKEDAFAQFAANVERNKRAYVDKSFHSLEILQTIT